eukprot:6209245-Pleurochrysis_carterae.AAC.4
MFNSTFTCGAAPLWDHPAFRERVLGNSLTPSASQAAAPPATLKTLLDALGLVGMQLQALSESTLTGQALRRAASRAHAAFARSLEISRMLPQASACTSVVRASSVHLRAVQVQRTLLVACY